MRRGFSLIEILVALSVFAVGITAVIGLLSVAGYWRAYEALIDRIIDEGFADAGIRDLFTVAEDVGSLLGALEDRAYAQAADSRRL